MKKLLIFLLMFTTAHTYAGDGKGKVKQLMAHDGDILIFQTEVHEGAPSCSKYGWALSLKTESGKAMFSLLLAAQARGKDVVVRGRNDCNDWGDRERPIYAYTVD